MGRRARGEILFDGCFAHIFSRSFDKLWLFEEGKDFQTFEKLLLEAKEKFGFLIHHYCLMHTHFHLLVSIPDVGRFSTGLQWLKREYTLAFNRRRKRSGPLWRERFKSQLIENESYLYACGRYIEENPVKANLVPRPEDWPHSSAAHYRLVRKNPLIEPYEFDPDKNALPKVDQEMMERGTAIGSELFFLHLEEGLLREVSVP